tara:strand:+ start:653 stop:1075 length:423 start_codon:yes stop_codon:yes gene_type:complete
MGYDEKNIFAKIIRGELPAEKIFENDKVLAFMDIMPRSPGHLLVIPKSSARNILDIDDENLCEVIKVVKKLAIASKKAMNATGVTIQQFSEADGGQEVFHLHFHIIPRYTGKPMNRPGQMVKDMTVLSMQANKIKAELGV